MGGEWRAISMYDVLGGVPVDEGMRDMYMMLSEVLVKTRTSVT